MDMPDTHSQLEMARNVHDLGSINKMREAIASGDKKVLQEAAQQFEAIFVQMMLKSMRKAQDVLADKDSPFNSNEVKFYRDMHDQQMASDLTSNGGMGLADIIVKQLGQFDENYTPASVLRNDGNLSSINRHAIKSVDQAQRKVLEPQTAGVAPAYKTAMFDSQEDFVAALYPHAQKAAEALGTDPKAIIAQAAVETGWGKHVIHDGQGNSSNNFFGIKARGSWQGNEAVVSTLEFDGTVPKQQKAAFRSYPSIEEGLKDYVDFIRQQPRYQDAVNQGADTAQYFESLQQAGYATDPNYANKVMSVFNSDVIQGFMP